MNLNYFNVALLFYFLSFLASVIYIVSEKKNITRIPQLLISLGFISHCLFFVTRWFEGGFMPLSNMFESLIFFGLAVVFLYFIFCYALQNKYLNAAAALVAFLALAYASKQSSSITPLMPALRSNWLTIHVIACFLGYAGFTLAFIASLTTLSGKTAANLESFTDSTVKFGVLFLFLGIATGAVWANQAWGAYWSWDPKETWSLITWCVYVFYSIHGHWLKLGPRGKAIISILGFLAVIITYLGVNYLPSASQSLHVY